MLAEKGALCGHESATCPQSALAFSAADSGHSEHVTLHAMPLLTQCTLSIKPSLA